jgi:muconolactone delta-isomerase
MRFFVTIQERACHDAQEHTAMLNHRLKAIAYHKQLLDDGTLHYAFYDADQPSRSFFLYEVDDLIRLDWLLKRDPLFPYATITTEPQIPLEALINEGEDFLGETILTAEERADLVFERRPLNPDANYWLVIKTVPPYSPLLSEEAQDDITRRTLVAQKRHNSVLEYADDNPVGKPIGILIAEAQTLEEVKEHVALCEVYMETTATFTPLLRLEHAWQATVSELAEMRRALPESSPFEGVVATV